MGPAFVWCLKIVLIRFSGSEALGSLWRRDTQGPDFWDDTGGDLLFSCVQKCKKTVFVASVLGILEVILRQKKNKFFLNFGGSDNYVSLNHELQVLVQIVEAFASPHQLWFYQDFFCVDFGPKIHPIEKEQHPKQTVMFGQVHIMRTQSSSLS